MSHYWLLLTFSWLGSARLQYISTSGQGLNLNYLWDSPYHIPIPYVFNQPQKNSYEDESSPNAFNLFSLKDLYQTNEIARQRRTVEQNEDTRNNIWQPNIVDTDKTIYLQGVDKNVAMPYKRNAADNDTMELNDLKLRPDKRSFSPWGGKRNGPHIENTWTWKRSVKEPSMPKRVRFSPWGGKRSGSVMYRPGAKASRIIFASSIPELTKIVSNYSPGNERLHIAGFQILPLLNKRGPLSSIDGKPLREELPFKEYIELPNIFKPGHTYTEVDIKRDGKRKIKFNAWGGKRSPPVIGPIWTPSLDSDDTFQDTVKENIESKHRDEYETQATKSQD